MEKMYYTRRRAPSFSSSLLDAISREIQKEEEQEEDRETTSMAKKKQRSYSNMCKQREIMIENWIQKQSISSSSSSSTTTTSLHFTSSSSDSSCTDRQKQQIEVEIKPKRENGFTKTKLKALKIYGKVKQPISPGGRITTFLNSFFSSGNAKKVNVCSVKAIDDVHCSASNTTSCLSKTTPSSKNRNVKRSVRFYPVGVIVDEDCRPCGHKCIYGGDEIGVVDEEGEDDDDGLSCSSSDLFELDHVIGTAARYREELPVYETTSFRKNQAIANGFLL